MASSRTHAALLLALSLAAAGGAAGAALSHSLWLALAGAVLVVGWLSVLTMLAVRRPPPASPPAASEAERETTVHRLLLDALPTPLLLIDGTVVRTLNRAARRLFDTDDRILPPPLALFDRDTSHLHHAGRSWRADRVDVGAQVVVAMVDVESEERTAEARASAEMVQVLGHELLNGLVPIVALAESGITAAAAEARDPALLTEILTTLARRAEGLHRFTEAYRGLARLPPPLRAEVNLAELVDDLARLFDSRWPEVNLVAEIEPGLSAALDRDQLSQALWALLQNAVEASAGAVQVSVAGLGADLAIDVVDDGPGIPSNQSHRIFRPFHTGKEGGSGIGLALARQIVQAHGGTLTLLQSTPPKFRILLPSSDKVPLIPSSANAF